MEIMKIYFFSLFTLTTLFICCKSTSENITPQPVLIEARGTWDNRITVPPDAPVDNEITFSGEATRGTFLDQFGHSGTWKLEGDSITWIYVGVPGLDNTFAGKIAADGQTMSGRNFGVWQGREFEGSWEAIKK